MRMIVPLLLLVSASACGDDDRAVDAAATDSGGRDAAGATDGGSAGDDCDPTHVTCDVVAPTCPPGFVPVVEGACWGPCISNVDCAPIPCDPAGDPGECPRGWGCVSSGQCAPPR